MKDSFNKDEIRNKVIGLGENSFHKSYYPQLQERIEELTEQKKLLEKSNNELNSALASLYSMQEILIQNEYKYRSLFENANDAIFIMKADDLLVLDCNNKALELFNYKDKAELIAKNVLGFAPEIQPNGKSSEEVAMEVLGKLFAGESPTFEWLTLTSDGHKVLCMIAISLIDIKGDKLLQAIIRDVSKIKKLEHELGMATIRSVENERLRFAKELHDGIGPILSTIKLYVEWLREENTNEDNQLMLDKAGEGIVEATKAIKEIAYNLSPHILSNYGLSEAISQFIENVTQIHPIKIECPITFKNRLNADFEVMLYRIITELINNSIKHANATLAKIKLKKKKNTLKLTYVDNGVGFDVEKVKNDKKGMGLFNLENRISQVGGSVEFFSKPGKGVKFEFYINDLNYFDEI